MSACLWCQAKIERPLTGRFPAFCCPAHSVAFGQVARRWAVAAVKAGRITTTELKTVGPSRIYQTKKRLAANQAEAPAPC
jgi:hypothetical protein